MQSTKQIGRTELAPELTQAALDALAEPIFLLDAQAATVTPLNSAARRWSTNFVAGDDGKIQCAICFPELDLAAIAASSARTWFTHCVNSATNQPCEVEFHLQPLAGHAKQQIMVMRPIGVLPGDEWLAHGALNGAFHDPLTGLANRRLFARRLDRAIERAGRGRLSFRRAVRRSRQF